jgi:dephospho-CoA kinase
MTEGPRLVGLTGGIGAGKSEALAALERLGAATLSTDAVVHELYADPEVVAAVTGRWGAAVAPDGVVDRAAVARAAFGDDGERQWLEGELWPRVGRRMWSWIEAQRARPDAPRAIVIEVPLLFESGMESGFDATLAVVAGEAVRAGRAGARGHEAVAERTTRQLSQEDKAGRATYVVPNDGSLEDLEAALSGILDRLNGASPSP